jgi:hypothetical protein
MINDHIYIMINVFVENANEFIDWPQINWLLFTQRPTIKSALYRT